MKHFRVLMQRQETRQTHVDVIIDTKGKTEWDITQEVIIEAHKVARNIEFPRSGDAEYEVIDMGKGESVSGAAKTGRWPCDRPNRANGPRGIEEVGK